MMSKTEALGMLRCYLPPDKLAAFMQAWWKWAFEDEAQVLTNGPQVDASGEPLLEDCKWCGQAHDTRCMDQCPLNPSRNPVAAYQAMEAALQALAGQILSLRTELLVIKAEIMKEDEQEYEDTRKYMEHHYTGGE